MALNIKDQETVRLANEVAGLAGETKTGAVKMALKERKAQLTQAAAKGRGERLRELLEHEIWPQISPDVLGQTLTKDQREEILGYGPDGV